MLEILIGVTTVLACLLCAFALLFIRRELSCWAQTRYQRVMQDAARMLEHGPPPQTPINSNYSSPYAHTPEPSMEGLEDDAVFDETDSMEASADTPPWHGELQ